MRRGFVLLLGVLITAGCNGSTTAPPTRGAVTVQGGTPSMRARADAILRRLGHTPIARVQFQRPPFAFAQYATDDHPQWLTVTVRAPGYAGQHQSASTSWALGYADIFERAYQASVPRGGFRLVGTSDERVWGGRIHYAGGGVSGVPSWAHARRTLAGVARAIRQAAAASRFTVEEVRVLPIGRLAAATVLRVGTHHEFASRLNAFGAAMGRLGYATDGVDWQLRDRCGNIVALVAGGTYINPRWECPNPWGRLLLPRGACQKQAAQQPICTAS